MRLCFSYIATGGGKVPVTYQLPEKSTVADAHAKLELVRHWYEKNGSKVVDVRIEE